MPHQISSLTNIALARYASRHTGTVSKEEMSDAQRSGRNYSQGTFHGSSLPSAIAPLLHGIPVPARMASYRLGTHALGGQQDDRSALL